MRGGYRQGDIGVYIDDDHMLYVPSRPPIDRHGTAAGQEDLRTYVYAHAEQSSPTRSVVTCGLFPEESGATRPRPPSVAAAARLDHRDHSHTASPNPRPPSGHMPWSW